MQRLLALLLLLAVFTVQADETLEFSDVIDNTTVYHEYPITLTAARNTIQITMQQSTGDLDTLVHLLDSTGAILASNDDAGDDRSRSYLEVAGLPAGAYRVIATRYKQAQGKSIGDFQLSIVSLPTVTQTLAYDTSPAALRALGFPELVVQAPVQWTIFAYYGGDTNLESAILNDLKEFELGGGSDTQVRIIALVDRSPAYDESNGNWASAKIFEVVQDISGLSADGLITIDTQELADLGDVDTGDGETLARFLTWGLTHFPAEHYALAFGSHGAAWQGLITDDTAGEVNPELGGTTILSLAELDAAFNAVLTASGRERFDLLINDACNMSSIEYYSIMQAYFNLSIASPEVVVNPALDMSLLIEDLRANDELVTLSEALIDTYISRDMAQHSQFALDYTSNAVTDLQHFAEVENHLAAFAELLTADMPRYASLLGAARANTYGYPVSDRNPKLIDLGDFMQQILERTNDSNVIFAVNDVLEALDASLLYGNAGQISGTRTSYYNLYFPESQKQYENTYAQETPLTAWSAFLRAYYASFTPDIWTDEQASFHPPLVPTVSLSRVYPEVGNVLNPFVISLEVTGRRIAQGQVTVDYVPSDGRAERLIDILLLRNFRANSGALVRENSWQSGIDTGEDTWPAILPWLSDGTNGTFVLTVANGESVPYIEGRYRSSDDEAWNDVGIIFSSFTDLTRSTTPQTVISRSAGISAIARSTGSQATAVIDIPEGAIFQPYRFFVNPEGGLEREASETSLIWQADGITLSARAAPTGNYRLGFLITVFGGDTAFTSHDVRVEQIPNLELETGYRVVNNPNFGFTTPPVTDYRVSPEGIGFIGDAQLFLGRLDLPRVELEQWLLYLPVNHDAIERIVTEHPQPQTINGTTMYALDFIVKTAQENAPPLQFTGWLIPRGANQVIFISPNPQKCQEATNRGDCLLNQLDIVTQIQFYEPSVPVSTWRRLDLGAAELHAVPPSLALPTHWQTGDNGIWLRMGDFVNAPQTFAAITQLVGSDVSTVLHLLYNNEIVKGQAGYSIDDRRSYYGENLTWDVLFYTATRNNESFTGRLYVAYEPETNYLYAFWFETPTEGADAVFSDSFELMLDGFEVGSPNWWVEVPESRAVFHTSRAIYDIVDDSAGELLIALPPNMQQGYQLEAVPNVTSLSQVVQAGEMDFSSLNPVSFYHYDALLQASNAGEGWRIAVYLPDEQLGLLLDCSFCSLPFELEHTPFNRLFIGNLPVEQGAEGLTSTYAQALKTVAVDLAGFSFRTPHWWLAEQDEDLPVVRVVSPTGGTNILARSLVDTDMDTPNALREIARVTDYTTTPTRIAGVDALYYQGVTEQGLRLEGYTLNHPLSNDPLAIFILSMPMGDMLTAKALLEESLTFYEPIRPVQATPPRNPNQQATPAPQNQPPTPNRQGQGQNPPPTPNRQGGNPPPPNQGGGSNPPPPPRR